jgi:diguanylate cyclase (GGDEF)-like protein
MHPTSIETANRNLASVYAVLAATNEALLYAATPQELFKRVCDAAVDGHNFVTVSVMRPDSAGWMEIEGASGIAAEELRQARISVDSNRPEGLGMGGLAYRSRCPNICNDYMNDERTVLWRPLWKNTGVGSAGVFPILSNQQSIGVMLFYASVKNVFSPDIVAALERIASNIAFALGNFEREHARNKAEQALRESEARFRSLTKLSSDWYWEQDAELLFTRMESRYVTEEMGPHRLIGRRMWDNRFEVTGGWSAFQDTLARRESYRDVLIYRTDAGKPPYYVSVSGEPVFDEDGTFTGYRGVSREVTEQIVAQENIRHMARHDALTGLPNRLMFSTLLNHSISGGTRYKRSFAVMFIDLDRFKFINDTLGHDAGDSLLQEITIRFQYELRASDVIARLGGDEFVVLLQEINSREHAATVASKILAAASKPIMLIGHECRVSASVGIAMFPMDGEDEQTLMKNADSAMYFAKNEGKNNFQFFSSAINSHTLERLKLESNLRRAMERSEFTLNYQAKLDLTSNTITGVEALLRWNNVELGHVPPDRFIPIAEETGLIVQIGRWVLRTACLQNMEWQRQGLPPINMAVNLSVRQFSDDNLVADITDILRDTGMQPSLLELEITEGMLIHNIERAIKLLTAIKKMGVRLAIDDFGTGYSSLGQLKNFPIDTLKVDRSFIRDLVSDSEDRAITSAIIAMGKTLSLTVIAEGVETLEQQTFLREQSCDEMQGYYFSKPVKAEEFAKLLAQNMVDVA